MATKTKFKVGILSTHPIQYYTPWYQALAQHSDLEIKVFYCHNPAPQEQGQAGFGVAFTWDIPLLQGYSYQFLNNQAYNPNVFDFWGCDTPSIIPIIKQGQFDTFIIHGWYNKSFWQAMWACWRYHVPLLVRGDSQIMTPRSWPKRFLKAMFYRWFIPKFSAYLAVGKRAAEYYLAYGANPQKIFFAPHAVDNNFFIARHNALAAKRNELRAEWGIQEQTCTFLFVGKLIPKKRPGDFLEALRLVASTNLNIVGIVVGDGPLRPELEAYVQAFDIPIRFIGFLNQSELPKVYTVSDVLILPSDGGETWGLVVNEAMASGLPAVVSDQVGCSADLVHPAVTGNIYPCGDVQKLSDTMQSLALNPGLRSQMAEQAFQLITCRYSITKAVEGTLQAIQFVASHHKSKPINKMAVT